MTTDPAPVVLITGASSGLGAEMARQLARRGWDLALCARRQERLEALADEVRAATGRRVEVAPLDVTDGAAVHRVVDEVAASFGRLDRVVVNAGVGKGAPLGTGRAEVNLATLETNLVGAFHQAEAAMSVFRDQGHGHLVLVSSIAAVRGLRGPMTAYAASKAGVSTLGEGLRAEAVPGVDVTVLHPGYIRTPLNEGATRRPFAVDVETGVRAMVRAIEQRRGTAYVPTWPWLPVALLLRVLPLSVLRRVT